MISSVLGSRTTAFTVVEPTSIPTTTARLIFCGSVAAPRLAPFDSFWLTVPMEGPFFRLLSDEVRETSRACNPLRSSAAGD
jgi:hypothetical protein